MSNENSPFRDHLQREVGLRQLGQVVDATVQAEAEAARRDQVAQLSVERNKLIGQIGERAVQTAEFLKAEGLAPTHQLSSGRRVYSDTRMDKMLKRVGVKADIPREVPISGWILDVKLERIVSSHEIGGGYGTSESTSFKKHGLALAEGGRIICFRDSDAGSTDLTHDLRVGSEATAEQLAPLSSYERLGSEALLSQWENLFTALAVRLTTTTEQLPPRPWHDMMNPAAVANFVNAIENNQRQQGRPN